MNDPELREFIQGSICMMRTLIDSNNLDAIESISRVVSSVIRNKHSICEGDYVVYAYDKDVYRVLNISHVNDNCLIEHITTHKSLDCHLTDLAEATELDLAKSALKNRGLDK